MTSQQTPESGSAAPARVEGRPSTESAGFAGDAGPRNLGDAARAYLAKVRGGDVGVLPALLGVVVLVAIFAQANDLFLTTGNLANLPAQGAGFTLIAMGLVFVLLLGEIDLSAGTAAGVCAGLMALAVTAGDGDLKTSLGSGTYYAVLVGMLLALAIGVRSQLWPGVAVVAVGIVLYLTGAGGNAVLAMALAVVLGVSIGMLTGFLVATVGIPSFVVTLALFLAWQGVLLKFIGSGNAIPVRQEPAINGLANRNLPVTLGWLFFGLLIGVYGAYTVWRSLRRQSQGLSAEPIALVVVRLVALAVAGGLVVWLLSEERGPNPALRSIKGVPYVVALIILLMVFWALVLAKTAFGRHLYAVGGNAEAARRAGINVARIRTAAFAISSGMAGLGGVVLASRSGGVPADLGGGNTLLYAVGAAVIGGTSLFGGRGKVRDAVLGGIVIAMIPNGLGLVGLGADFNFMITGLVLLVAASVDALSRKRAAATGR